MIISYAVHDEDEWLEMKQKLMNKYELSDVGDAKMIVVLPRKMIICTLINQPILVKY
jgi:hypothetical protein